jgi:formylglycine-generating enzyme required for sulfatase activity
MSAIYTPKHLSAPSLLLGAIASAVWAQGPCIGNLNNDGAIDGIDLGALLGSWGPCVSACPADLNADGNVDGVDLGVLLSGWGTCPGVPPWATVLEWSPDPQVVTDATLREGIVATGHPWRVRDIGTGIELLLVPPGTFMMGCSPSYLWSCWPHESPVHQVTPTRAFYLGRYETTQSEWTSRMGFNPSYFSGFPDSPRRPVEDVGVNQIAEFLAVSGLRIPTEAEWEYACRAGTTTAFYNGSNDDACLDQLAWYGLNSNAETHPVGLKPANRLGFHDMLGNVFELTDGCPGYNYTPETRIDPADPPCPTVQPPTGWPFTMLRGGSWYAPSEGGELPLSWVRVSSRAQAPCCGGGVGLRGTTLGFRVARNP